MASKPSVYTSLGALPVQMDLLSRDSTEVREQLIATAKQLATGWTDFAPSDPGVTILELVAYITDHLNYYIDRAHNESYLPTAQERLSVIHLLRLIGYELRIATSAAVTLTVVTDAPGVVLPAGYAVDSEASELTPSHRFELDSAVTLVLAGTHEVSTFGHGESVDETLGASDGAENQQWLLSRDPLTLLPTGVSPLKVYVNGLLWTETDSFLSSDANSETYVVRIDENDAISVIFGDGVSGKIPPTGHALRFVYVVGGGEAGNNVGIGKVTTPATVIAGVVSVTNAAQPSGGRNKETISEAKQAGPLTLRTQDRCVTLEDFEVQATLATGAGITAAVAEHNGPSAIDVNVFAAASGNNPVPTGKWYWSIKAGSGQLGQVGRHLLSKMVHPTRLHVYPCIPVRPQLEARVYVLPNALQSQVAFEVNRSLVDYNATLLAAFGRGSPKSAVIQAIENTRGVDWVELMKYHRAPATRLLRGVETAHDLATVDFTLMQEGMVADRYVLKWTSASTFVVTGDNYGPIVDANGAVETMVPGTAYVIRHRVLPSDPNRPDVTDQFTLEVTLGAGTPSFNDQWEFSTDAYLDNIGATAHEIIVATVDVTANLDPSEFAIAYENGIV